MLRYDQERVPHTGARPQGRKAGERDPVAALVYLQPAQDEEEQPPQPELPLEDDEVLPDDLPMPKRDMSFSVFDEPHFSHATSGFAPNTSFSKSVLQALQ
jgi:hypothetical protein